MRAEIDVATPGARRTDPGTIAAQLESHLRAVGVETLGFGPDPYSAAPTTHPMALALYARGIAELRLQGIGGAPSELVQELGGRLAATASSDPRAWGLRFGWRDGAADEPYAITTAICGRAFLSLYRATGSERDRRAAAGAAEWLCDALAWPELPGTGHAAPAFSPGLAYAIPNVASMVAGFLWEAAVLLDPRYADRALEATLAVLAVQDGGSWRYGDTGRRDGPDLPAAMVVDLVHSSYTLTGLAECVAHGPALGGKHAACAADSRRALAEGLRFVESQLATSTGWCREKVALADDATAHGAKLVNRPGLRRRRLSGNCWVVAFPAESRLWGYGAWLAAVAQAIEVGVADAEALVAPLGYVWAVLAREPSGRFPLTAGDRRAFPRHEAHLFQGLTAARGPLGEATS
jgi:hypothetical protein